MSRRTQLLSLFVIITLALQWRLWYGDTGLLSLWAMKSEIQQSVDSANQLIEQSQRMQTEVQLLQQYPQASEGLIRKYLNFTKEDETLIIMEPVIESKQNNQNHANPGN